MAEDAPIERKSRYPAYTEKPIFVNGLSSKQHGNIWEQAARRRARLRSASASSSGSGSGDSTRSDVGAGTGTNANWMSGPNAKGMGLQEAFARTGEDYRPKTAPGFVSTSQMKEQTGPTPNRTSRSRSSSGSIELKEGTSPIIREMFERAEREEIAKMTPRPERSAAIDYESESSGPREASPSPATRNTRQFNRGTSGIKKLVVDRNVQDGSEKPLTQLQKDLAYRKRLLANPNPIFLGRRVTEPTGQVSLETGSTDLDGEARRASISSLEDEPEPPLNIPRSWGAKARARPGWVQRILSPDQSLEIKNEIESINAEYEQSMADIPLPSVEPGPEPTPPSSRPASAQPNTEFLEEKSYLQPWDADVDFTGESFLASSPKLKIKPGKLDHVNGREVRSLNARSLATNRLEEIKERNSEEPSFIPDVVTGSEGGETFEQKKDDNASGQKKDGVSSGHEKDDSWEELRALSRILAPKSPRIVRDEGEDEPTTKKASEKTKEKQVAQSEDTSRRGKVLDPEIETKRRSRGVSPPKSDVDPEERITAEAKLFELRDDKSEKNSIRAPSPAPSDEGKNDETPRPKADPLSLPTPKVTGAYIDTPAPSSRKLASQRSISSTYEFIDEVDDASSDKENKQTETRRSGSSEGSNPDTRSESRVPPKSQTRFSSRRASSQRQRPRVINTAKRTTAAEDLQRIKLEENIEDSTLDDLDLLLENEATATADLMDTKNPIVDLEYDERGLPLTPGEKERRIERVILERMAMRLKNTSSSIRDARQGIERLEKEVSTAPVVGSVAAAGDADAHYVQIHIKMKMPRLYTVDSTPATSRSQNAGWFAKRNWKFTWFGLILFLFAAWYLAETAMCEVFCHPKYSSKNTWKPTDPFFPWAIPTKLDQWTGEVVSGTMKGIETIVMDWYDPDRFKRPLQPRYMPAPMYRPSERAGSIYDDEVYDG